MGIAHLRFDDTNPETEEMRYVEAFQRDIRWLGFDWGDRLFYASDYFEQLYEFALILIDKGVAYVDSSDEETIRAERGSVVEPGNGEPVSRTRSIDENRDLFQRMRAGEFENGAHVLRAKIDMTPRQHGHARPSAMAHSSRESLPPWRRVVHLPAL